MKKVLRKAVTALRCTVVVLCSAVLTISGASSAQRIYDAYLATPDRTEPVSEHARLLPGPPSPDQMPENMTPTGKPNCEPCAWISTPLIHDSNNHLSRTIEGQAEKLPLALLAPAMGRKSSIKATASLVSSYLGRQFTLVGARPSGTS